MGTYHEGRVVLDESIWTTGDYFDLGSVCRKSGEKAEQGGERKEFREHDQCTVIEVERKEYLMQHWWTPQMDFYIPRRSD